MAVQTEPNRLNDFLAWEEVQLYSRDKVTILADEVLAVGQVVGKVTVSGKYVAFNQDGEDGSQNAAGIVIDNYDATGADIEGVIIARHAMVKPDGLVWPGDIEAGEKEAALAQLEALGITTREEA
jgi:hypothetical protein